MKKFLQCIVFAMLFAALVVPGAAMAANENDIYVDGHRVVSDTPTYLKSGVTYVPLRFVSEALGAEVSWDGGSRSAICHFTEAEISIQTMIGSDSMLVNGNLIHHGFGRAEITNSRTFVPLRVIAEATGANVDWVPGRIDITSPAYGSNGQIDVYTLPVAMLGLPAGEAEKLIEGEPYNIMYGAENGEGTCYVVSMMARDLLSSSAFPANTIIDERIKSVLSNHSFYTGEFDYISSEPPFYFESNCNFALEDGTIVRMTLESTSIVPTLDNTMVTYRLVGW